MAAPSVSGTYVPPPYPHDRLVELRAVAAAVPGGLVDASVGTPIDPMPELVVEALGAAVRGATGYPPAIGTRAFREAAAGWVQRRFAVGVTADDVVACVGTKEFVASLPGFLTLLDPARDTILYPGVSYPTYAMGAELARLRAVPVPVDDDWQLDLEALDPGDVARARLLWLNDPSNPTGASASPDRMDAVVAWAREHGILVASDECYAEFTYDAAGAPAPPVTALRTGTPGVLAAHSLSKRSNMAGLRAGFIVGDRALIGVLGELRKHAGLMMPTPVQAAAIAALGDDTHVADQRARYARRRAVLQPALEAAGLVHDGGPSTFYLWLRDVEGASDGWEITRRLAQAGTLVAPGDFYGTAGVRHARLALSVTDDQAALAAERLSA